MKTGHKKFNGNGFTLTELAIVLVIVALLISGILLPLAAQRDLQSTAETQKQLSEIKEALLGFAAANGRLPRPATSLTDGTENPLICADDTACTGAVPWTTLGVKRSDGWNKIIRYSVTPAFANTTFALTTFGSKKVQTRDTAGTISYLIGSAAACSSTAPCAPAVLYSAGRDHWGIMDDGTVLTDGSLTNADEDTNASATIFFIARDFSTVPTGGEFDDIVVWLSPNILFNRMISAGRLP